MKLSLIVPCYNEAENVLLFEQAVIKAFADFKQDYEIVYIDDGSKDATLHNLKKLYKAQNCHTKVISFSTETSERKQAFMPVFSTQTETISA